MIDVPTSIRRSDEHEGAPLRVGFCDAEMKRLSTCLARLLPNLREDDVAITGGVAIQMGMARLGREGMRETIADLDMVATALDSVLPSVADTFLVSHYHSVRPGVPKFMVQLVDPATRIRVDIFPDLAGSLERSRAVEVGSNQVRSLALEDILEHKLLTISKASPASPVDPKHADDAYALGELLQRAVPAIHRHHLTKDVYGVDAAEVCQRCVLSSSDAFPLASKDEIFRLLGYV
jgi:hypothetical protein